MLDPRQEALIAVAYDYYNHRSEIQYDQLSLDRYLQITPRRRKFFPPEAATPQSTLHLDCSSFCFAVYYQALGYELPYDITWHMYEHLEPLVFKYEKTFEEDLEDKKRFADTFEKVLQPGDLITMIHQGLSGHIMLYVGEGKFMHCRPHIAGKDDSYNYVSRMEPKNRFAIALDNVSDIIEIVSDEIEGEKNSFKRFSFFSPKETKIAVHRPWKQAKNPTAQALIRCGKHRGLHSSVIVSHPGTQQAAKGDEITYSVKVKNLSDEIRSVIVEFQTPEGTSFEGKSIQKIQLERGEEKELDFHSIVEIKAAVGKPIWIGGPLITVNGLAIHVKPVLIGSNISDDVCAAIVGEVKEEMVSGLNALEAAAKVYGRRGIPLDPVKKNHIIHLFNHFDTCAKEQNNILIRREQNPYEDMAVYGLFGGKGVVTGEVISKPYCRTTEVCFEDFMAGDILLCMNDPFGLQTHALFFTGNSLIGVSEPGLPCQELKGDALNEFICTLFGRFCFVVLRPLNYERR